MSGEAKRYALFRVGAKALRAITGHDGEDLYACPLCQRLFAGQAVNGPEPALTLEHVPPARLGGKRILLTCQSCNSKGGHRLDAQAIARREFTTAVEALVLGRGTYEGKATWRFGGERFAGDVMARGTNVRLNVSGKATDPRAGPEARTRARRKQEWGEKIEFTVTPSVRVDLRQSQLGDLRSAYLVAFAALGYSYVFHPKLDQIRDQILNPEKEALSAGFWAQDRKASGGERRLFLGQKPRVVGVQIGRAWVFLPCPDSPADVLLEVEETLQEPFHASELAWPRSLEMAIDALHEARGSPPRFRLVDGTLE